MDTLMQSLTTAEAAVAAGVSLPQINRVIDERILPETWYSTSPIRRTAEAVASPCRKQAGHYHPRKSKESSKLTCSKFLIDECLSPTLALLARGRGCVET